jgi:predicted transcriptional regulator
MTMLSFRVSDDEAAEVQRWAEALGMDRSEVLRDALHRHLVGLSGEHDAEAWAHAPLTDSERSLEGIADWGSALSSPRMAQVCRTLRDAVGC